MDFKVSFHEQLQYVTTLVFDVDGVLTDGGVFITDAGDHFRRYNIKDGFALQLAVKCGFNVCAISGANAKNMKIRLNALGVKDVYLGVKDKLRIFEKYLLDNSIDPEGVLYMGDDIPDLNVMKLAGIPVCPADAASEIRAISHYISPITGGNGCARDVIEKVLKAQEKWMTEEAFSW